MTVRGTIIINRSPKVVLKEFKKIMKAELKTSIQTWHDKFLKRHFFKNASLRYKYADRSEKYLKRKKKVVGHTRPLVFTGKLRREMLRRIDLSGSSKGASGKLRKPLSSGKSGVSRYPKAKFNDELVAITQEEISFLAKDQQERMAKKMNTASERRIVRV